MIYRSHKRSSSAARPWFAWFPIQMVDGRTAWMTVVNRYVNRDTEYVIYYPIDGVTR